MLLVLLSALASPDNCRVRRVRESLLTQTAKARKEKPEDTENEKRLKEEKDIMQHITQKTALQSVQELAKVGRPCHLRS